MLISWIFYTFEDYIRTYVKLTFNVQQVSGNIVGSTRKIDWLSNHGDSWILFYMVNGLTVSGNGQIDGQGPMWWKNACIGTPVPVSPS